MIFVIDQNGRLCPGENSVNVLARRCRIGRVWLKNPNQVIEIQ